MALKCPDCTTGSLTIFQRLELPPDSMDDEITLQIVGCDSCRLRAIAVYRESRRGAQDSETVGHRGFRVSTDDLQLVNDAIERCPTPSDSDCLCPTHRSLGRTVGHRWDGLQLNGITVDEGFNIQWAE